MGEEKEVKDSKKNFDVASSSSSDVIVFGRPPGDVKKFGTKGAILLGKNYVEQDDKLVEAQKVYMDVSGAHVLFICGKRGGGKSYTMGVVAEGFDLLEDEVKKNLSIIMLDTMGVYWTMGHANKKEKELLEPYGITPHGIKLRIFTPEKFYYEYKEKGIPTDDPFTMAASELTGDDWCMAFKQEKYDRCGVLIQKTISELKEKKENTKQDFYLDDIINAIQEDKDSDNITKTAVLNMFKMAKGWGLFGKDPTPITELSKGGQLTILDVSCYATMPGGWDVKALVVGIVAQHLFVKRMEYRKGEEFGNIKYLEDFFANTDTKTQNQDMPLVWLVIDEAHEFLPKDKDDWNAATMPLVIIMREGRQPGISVIFATQQPGKIHTDVMTQSDMVLSHRITARMDVDALGLLAQSYMQDGITRAMNTIPRVKGTAVFFDDANEKIYRIRVRPRFTWHGGASPSAIRNQ
ncbi:ATP-binding protein [Candidatus Woesearchaeota archaeon]|nr:ATP-binding protein [Candidatus Woesearchaeota archaeon]